MHNNSLELSNSLAALAALSRPVGSNPTHLLPSYRMEEQNYSLQNNDAGLIERSPRQGIHIAVEDPVHSRYFYRCFLCFVQYHYHQAGPRSLHHQHRLTLRIVQAATTYLIVYTCYFCEIACPGEHAPTTTCYLTVFSPRGL